MVPFTNIDERFEKNLKLGGAVVTGGSAEEMFLVGVSTAKEDVEFVESVIHPEDSIGATE